MVTTVTDSRNRIKKSWRTIRANPLPTLCNFFGLLPEKVWLVILENVDNSRDYFRICEASPVFHDLLSSMRNQALFPEVLKIMMEQVADKDNQDILKPQDLASLRQVCRSWRRGVDRLLSQPFSTLDNRGLYKHDYFTVLFSQSDKLEKFQKHFASTHSLLSANPFPARSLEINLPNDAIEQDTQAFYTACLDLLSSYGKHVWHFEIDFRLQEPAPLYAQLKKMLFLMPNLKSFQFINQSRDPTISEQDLESLLNSPLVTLPDLTYATQSGMHAPVFRDLIINASRSQFQCLRMQFREGEQFRQFFASTELSINVYEAWLMIPAISVDWAEVFSGLATQFGETLGNLGIALPPMPVPFRREDRLMLPKLKKFYVKLHRPVPMDFLLGMESTLEELDITIEPFGEDLSFEQVVEEEQDVKLYCHMDQLERSHIWEKFPKLKMLRMETIYREGNGRIVKEVRTCTRSMWEWEEWSKINPTV